MEPNSHLSRVVYFIINHAVETLEELFWVSLVNKLHWCPVHMLSTNPQEEVGLWIPMDPLLSRNFIEHEYSIACFFWASSPKGSTLFLGIPGPNCMQVGSSCIRQDFMKLWWVLHVVQAIISFSLISWWNPSKFSQNLVLLNVTNTPHQFSWLPVQWSLFYCLFLLTYLPKRFNFVLGHSWTKCHASWLSLHRY